MYIYHYLGSDQDRSANGGVVFPFMAGSARGAHARDDPDDQCIYKGNVNVEEICRSD